MKIAKLKKLSIAYAMALCCQPLLTRIEMNVHKMLLMKEPMDNMGVPMEISNIIKRNLHDVTHINPVLDGKLIYTADNGEGEKATFNIKDLVKTDGCIDLSNKIFGDISKYFLITTDLEQFFSINQNGKKLVMLIAPRFLIEEKIGPSAKPFEEIMDNWKEDQAPIGIFWRFERWKNLGSYWYLTSKNLIEISKNNLHKLLVMASTTRMVKTMTAEESAPPSARSIILLPAFMFICEPK